MARSDYAPLVHRYMQALLDAASPTANKDRKHAMSQQARETAAEVDAAVQKAQKQVEKGNDYFAKHGGWTGADPDPLPPNWERNNKMFQDDLWNYQLLVAVQTIGKDFWWFEEMV